VSPYEVKAEAGDGRVKLLWRYAPYTGEPGDVVVGFNIYREEKDAKTRRVNSTLVLRQEGQLSRVDNEVVNGASYTYTVRAVDFVGRESGPSGTATAVPRDSKPPAVPRGLIAAAQEGKIIVSWKKGPDPDISYYDIYRGLSSQDQFTKVNVRPVPANTPNFVDTSVVFGPYYFYKVKATDMSGNESEFSASIPARPGDNTAPYPPAGVTTSVAGRIVRLQWKGTTSQDVLGYYVYRGLRADNLLRIVSTPLPADSAGHSDGGFGMRGLNPGTTYYYAVSAIDSANNESGRTTAIVKIPDNEAPAPPFDVRANANNYGIIDVGWQPSPSLDVSEFRVYRARNLQPHQRIATVRAFGWRDSAVVRGERYEYRVAAVDSSGNESTMSPPAIAVSSSVYLPPAPSGVRALLSGTTVAITWSPVDPRELLGYNVYRSPRPSGAFEKLNTQVIKVTKYADGSGKAGMYYRVATVSTSGQENTGGEPVQTEEKR
jgi:fibronectin type 3 domain-containing protein